MDKPFKTIDEQIEILRARNMIVNENLARDSLMKKGYYNIINGYKDFFLKENGIEFKDGTHFSDLENLFTIDKMLSHLIFYAYLDVERMFKTSLAYFIAEKYGEKEIDYLNSKNYSTGKNLGYNKWQIDETIKIFKMLAIDDIQPIKHYRDKYKNVPPWILFSRATFGNVYYLYKLSKADIKTKIISSILNINANKINDAIKRLFSDAMFLVLHFRNRTAHANRTYNFKIKASNSFLEYNNLFHSYFNITKEDHKNGLCRYDTFALIAALRFLYKDVYNKLAENLYELFRTYKNIRPSNYNDLLLSVGIPENQIEKNIKDVFPKC